MRIIGLIFALALQACGAPPSQNVNLEAPISRLYSAPQQVTITGYNGDAMEPFISRDGKFLLFNNSNEAPANTNLHYAARVNDVTFQYRGEIANANSSALEGVPTMDKAGNLYFVSTRSYGETFSTIYHAKFANGAATNVTLVPNISLKKNGMLNFDVEVSASGDEMYFVDGKFSGGAVPDSADIVLATKTDGTFARAATSAEIFKQINTAALEFAPCISTDGLTLLFTRLQKSDLPKIYISQRASTAEPFGSPARLAELGDFVEAPSLSPDESSLYYHQKVGKKYVIFKAKK
jgi:hypothetical protein